MTSFLNEHMYDLLVIWTDAHMYDLLSISVCNYLLDDSSVSDISQVDLFIRLIVIISTSKKLGNYEVRESGIVSSIWRIMGLWPGNSMSWSNSIWNFGIKDSLVSAGTTSTTTTGSTTTSTEESTTVDDIYTYDELAAILGALTTEESTNEEQGYFYVDLTVSLDLELQLIM